MTGLDDEVGDEDTAEKLSAAAVARFVKYLELLRARDGEDGDVLDIRVELETHDTSLWRPRRGTGAERRGARRGRTDARAAAADPRRSDHALYLLSGIIQVELPRRQALLEAETTVERLVHLLALLDREILLLRRRLRLFTPDLGSRTG